MRFRDNSTSNDIPTIDLIPMLTVMMGVLAFFVVVSVALGSEQLIQVDLPPEQTEDAPIADMTQEPFIVEMDATGQQLLNGTPVTSDQLTVAIDRYLAENTEQTVYLVPNRELPYEQVMQFLGDMRNIGGNRVSLALEEEAEEEAEEETEEKANEARAEGEDQ